MTTMSTDWTTAALPICGSGRPYAVEMNLNGPALGATSNSLGPRPDFYASDERFLGAFA